MSDTRIMWQRVGPNDYRRVVAKWYCRQAIPLSGGEPFEYSMNACSPNNPHDWRCHWAVSDEAPPVLIPYYTLLETDDDE